jgi:hypothetical protein
MDYDVSKYECADEGEVWIKVLGKEYSVSSHGRVFSWKTRLKYSYRPIGLLTIAKHNLGYRYTTLDGKPIYLHRLVASCFMPTPDDGLEVNHIDHDKANNHVSNLEWVTHKENIQKSYTEGGRKTLSGPDHHRFGAKASRDTKAKQSAAKMGDKHPKFIGHSVVNGERFESANQAANKIGRSAAFVMKRCKGGAITGWSFEPKR